MIYFLYIIMKKLILIIIVFVLGALFGANMWYKMIQDMSTKTVKETFEQSKDLLLESYSGSVSQEILNEYNAKLQEQIELKKQEINEEIKKSLKEYINDKIDNMFGGSSEDEE